MVSIEPRELQFYGYVSLPVSLFIFSTHRVIENTIKCQAGAQQVQFSPDPTSSFVAVVSGTRKCSVFSTASFELVQEIPCQLNCNLTSLAFDPSGTLLAIGGKTESFRSGNGGAVLVVRVGELLRLQWFFSDTAFVDPLLLCQKLAALSEVERAQILYHKTDDGEEGYDHGSLPLERRIRYAIDAKREHNSMLGSHMMTSRPPNEQLVVCLKEVFKQFPQSVFAISPGYGNLFDVAFERENPRLLSAVFSVALIACRSYPYLMMNEEMRSGRVTNALIAACDIFPQGIVVLRVLNIVVYPAISVTISHNSSGPFIVIVFPKLFSTSSMEWCCGLCRAADQRRSGGFPAANPFSASVARPQLS